jgi:hypothetical protein
VLALWAVDDEREIAEGVGVVAAVDADLDSVATGNEGAGDVRDPGGLGPGDTADEAGEEEDVEGAGGRDGGGDGHGGG